MEAPEIEGFLMVEQRRLAEYEWVDIVRDENGSHCTVSRERMRARSSLRHRATYIVVHDGMGKILVQRRTETKIFAGMLDTAGGVVEADDALLESARRETEVGRTGVPFAEHGLFYFEKTNIAGLGRAVCCVSHGPFAFRKMKSARCVG